MKKRSCAAENTARSVELALEVRALQSRSIPPRPHFLIKNYGTFQDRAGGIGPRSEFRVSAARNMGFFKRAHSGRAQIMHKGNSLYSITLARSYTPRLANITVSE
jgi:hypothetical protein